MPETERVSTGQAADSQPLLHEPIPDSVFKPYLEHRSILISAEQDASKGYSRWLLTLSGGALAMSIAFAKDIAMPAGAQVPICLLGAWSFLVFAVLTALISLYQEPLAHEEFRDILDAEMIDCPRVGAAGFWARVREKQKQCGRPKWISWLNRFSLAGFILGVVFLAVFAMYNVPKG